MTTQTKSRIVAVLFGTAVLGVVVPAQAEWGGGYGGTPMPSGGSSSCVPGATNCKSGGSAAPGGVKPGGWGQGGGMGGRPSGGWSQGGGYGGGMGGRPTGGWGQGGGYGSGMRHCPMGDCGFRPVGYGGYGAGSYGQAPMGKVCYNFAGRPYIHNGPGRCPIS